LGGGETDILVVVIDAATIGEGLDDVNRSVGGSVIYDNDLHILILLL
jgi:hypothetical protein